MSTMKIEIQDHEGNVYHPHTDAKVVFTSDGKTVEEKLESLKQSASNGKNIVATAIGSPLLSNDTFTQMGTKIDTLTQNFQDILKEKGVEVIPNDKMLSLIGKVENITQVIESLSGDRFLGGLIANRLNESEVFDFGIYKKSLDNDESIFFEAYTSFSGVCNISFTGKVGKVPIVSDNVRVEIYSPQGVLKASKNIKMDSTSYKKYTLQFDNISYLDRVTVKSISWKWQSGSSSSSGATYFRDVEIRF